MQKHVKVYLDYFNAHGETIICECCKASVAVDIHHIKPRSQLGKDEISNLVALCRECHDAAHREKISKYTFYKIIECRT